MLSLQFLHLGSVIIGYVGYCRPIWT